MAHGSFTFERLNRLETAAGGEYAQEVADAICFAASEGAGYITGAVFDINGGDLMM